MPVALKVLLEEANRYLNINKISDYCPNGLQVEGKAEISRVVSGVTASQALLDAAVAAKADAVLVHHGYFWKNESPCVVGVKQRRLKTLLLNDISLLAYHLPLDVHPEVGNNVQLARLLGIEIDSGLEPENPRSVGLIGHFAQPVTPAFLRQRILEVLGREPLMVEGSGLIQRIAWCSGGAPGYIEQAIAAGVDAYLTGEPSEPAVHLAQETGMSFFAAGHHATERCGVQALGDYLAQKFGIEHQFIDCPNPV